jgi:hypothetical protein
MFPSLPILEQQGHGITTSMSNQARMSNPIGMLNQVGGMVAEARVHSSQRRMVGFNDLVEVKEVIAIGGIKNKHVALQCKECREIMANAQKMAIERKGNG